jgi:hypothetical protein
VEISQTVQRACRKRVVASQHLLTYRQRALEERLGLRIRPLGLKQSGQVIQTRCRIWVVASQHPLIYRQRPLDEWPGLHIRPLGLKL